MEADVLQEATATDTELAWAAGVFEATGTATVSRRTPMLNIKQAVAGGDSQAEMLLRFSGAIGGLGRIGGPYRDRQRSDRARFFMWYAQGAQATSVIERLWPWLGDSKRAQWFDVMTRKVAAA